VTAWLDSRARAHIEREASRRRLLETGGALFGYERDGELVIACASGPGPHAKHRPRRFEPHRPTTAAAMRAVAASSEGRCGYIGSWHTHPCGAAAPSGLDSRTARDLAEQEDLGLPRPLVLIVGTRCRTRPVRVREVRSWRWQPVRGVLEPVELRTCELTERYCPSGALFGA
jgi:integrative and conjugative element protein (TIGR02256 family)